MSRARSVDRTWKEARLLAFWISLFLIVGLSLPALAVPGALDSSFSGALDTSFDGQIVVAGEAVVGNRYRFSVSRYDD